MVPEDGSYQTLYFTEVFLSPLASTLHIHFYLHLKESSENGIWIIIAHKSVTFSAPETMYILCYFSKTWPKLWEEADVYVCFDGIDQFYSLLFSLCQSFVIGENYVWEAPHFCGCNGIWTLDYLVCKRKLNHLAKLTSLTQFG